MADAADKRNLDVFKKNINLGINEFNVDKLRHFAWLCAVRSLPFLGNDVNFGYWNERDIQINIFTLFQAIDSAYPAKKDISVSFDAVDEAVRANDIANESVQSVVYAATNATRASARTSRDRIADTVASTALNMLHTSASAAVPAR
jgi:hypothetical protein